jgi:hypothetical protein
MARRMVRPLLGARQSADRLQVERVEPFGEADLVDPLPSLCVTNDDTRLQFALDVLLNCLDAVQFP